MYLNFNNINAKREKTNEEFLYNALKTLEKEISEKGTGSTFNAITKKDVYEIEIPKSSLESQNEFSEFSQLLDKIKLNTKKRIKALTEFLNKKLDEYFGDNE